jgi:hypothetical protein
MSSWPGLRAKFWASLDLHRLFQFLGNPECDLLARLDLDGLAGRRIPPILAACFRTWRMPRPVRRILSPFFRWRVVSVTKSPSTASACFFAMSWLSANAAARCLRVMVAWMADLAGAVFFAAGFLAGVAGMGFLAVLGVKSTGHGRPDSSNPNDAQSVRSLHSLPIPRRCDGLTACLIAGLMISGLVWRAISLTHSWWPDQLAEPPSGAHLLADLA